MKKRREDTRCGACGQQLDDEGCCPGLKDISYAARRHVNALRKRRSLWTSDRLLKLLEGYTTTREGAAYVSLKSLAEYLAPRLARRPSTRRKK